MLKSYDCPVCKKPVSPDGIKGLLCKECGRHYETAWKMNEETGMREQYIREVGLD